MISDEERDAYHRGVGKVTIAAGLLEFKLAHTVWYATGAVQGQSFMEPLTKSGQVMRLLERAAAECPVPGLIELHNDAKALFAERGALVHGVITYSFTGGDESQHPDGVPGLFHPRTAAHRGLPSADEYDDLEHRILECLSRAEQIVFPLLEWLYPGIADSVRTDEEPDG